MDEEGRVHLRNVHMYRDYGTTVELRDGLQGGERVVLTAPADIVEGQRVNVAAPEESAAK